MRFLEVEPVIDVDVVRAAYIHSGCRIMSTKYSALWSSLRTLELISPFTSIRVDPPVAYETPFFGGKEVRLYKRHQKVASALALIGATSSDVQTVTACSAEVSYPSNSSCTVVILRVAQNQRMPGREIFKLQDLVDGLMAEISRHEQNVWADRKSAFFCVWMMFIT